MHHPLISIDQNIARFVNTHSANIVCAESGQISGSSYERIAG